MKLMVSQVGRVGDADEAELSSAQVLKDLAFSNDCEKIAWVESHASVDVKVATLATGVVTQVTDDGAVESAPAFSADGTVLWFGQSMGNRTVLATVDLVTGAEAVAFAPAVGDATSPAPSRDGDVVAFVLCHVQCRLAVSSAGAWSYLDTAAPGPDKGWCEAAEPRWLAVDGRALLVYLRGDGDDYQVVTASGAGVVRGALVNGATGLR